MCLETSFMNKAHELLASFKSRFGTGASVCRAPGRVNLIGEHTDYNDGYVLPAAIGFSCWVGIAPRVDRQLILFSENYGEVHEAGLDELGVRGSGHWSDYPLGVAWALQEAGYRLRGANIDIAVAVPLGAGLSSSATIRRLRDVSLEQLVQNRSLLSETIYRRCRHVISENERVHEVADLFEQGKTEGLREVMAASHQSLRDDYEVSCQELDAMVEIAGRQRGVYGARMTGGGFGGCTINFVDVEHATEFQQRVSEEYESAIGLRPDIYICEASQGAELVETTAESLPRVSR